LGVLGVGSDAVVYLPVSKEPPDLDSMPRADSTGAMLPEAVAPTDAVSIISCALICDLHGCFALIFYYFARACNNSVIAYFDTAMVRIHSFKSYGVYASRCRYLKIFFQVTIFPRPCAFSKQFIIDVGSVPKGLLMHLGSDITFYPNKISLHRDI
jgi:hypothetical protein